GRGFDDLSIYFLVYSAGMMVAQPVWLAVSRRINKRNAILIALAISPPVALSWYLSGPLEPIFWVHARAFFLGFGGGGVIMLGQAMLPDTIEYDVRRTGLRREGLFAALYTPVEKVSGAAGVTI